MKTFEEKWTAWLDGQLTGKELVEFEASLPDRTADICRAPAVLGGNPAQLLFRVQRNRSEKPVFKVGKTRIKNVFVRFNNQFAPCSFN